MQKGESVPCSDRTFSFLTLTNEKDLLAQLQDKKTKERAFSVLIREFQESLYWQIRRMVISHEDANDILQNTMIKAWSSIDNFEGRSQLKTWLSRIATNETLTFLDKKEKNISIDEIGSSVSRNLLSDSYFDGDQTQIQLQEAISKLPKKQRLVFNLKYFQEMKYEEMSQILGTSIGALKASYHLAVKKICEHFHNID